MEMIFLMLKVIERNQLLLLPSIFIDKLKTTSFLYMSHDLHIVSHKFLFHSSKTYFFVAQVRITKKTLIN